jgi:hypothetical protein
MWLKEVSFLLSMAGEKRTGALIPLFRVFLDFGLPLRFAGIALLREAHGNGRMKDRLMESRCLFFYVN